MNEYIDQLPYREYLTDSEIEYLEYNSAVLSYDKGYYLKDRGGSCLGMIYVLSGSLRALMISEEGREITLFRLGPGDSCVLSASCLLSQISFDTELVTTEASQIMIVNSGAYSKLMEQNVHVKCFTYELAMQRSSAVIWVLQQILFAKFDQRLAGFLLAACEASGKNEITMTKEAIAKEVNTAREVVSRMLKQFADDGLIKTDRKTIFITDVEGLKKIL